MTERLSIIEVDKKESFQSRLAVILNTPPTVETVNIFAEEALHQLIILIKEIAQSYQEETCDTKIDKEIEDKAFAKYQLGDVEEILINIQNKQNQINSISEYIHNQSYQSNKVITPPDSGPKMQPGSGKGGFDNPNLIPRLTTLLYILESDFNISKEQVLLLKGLVRDHMVRQEPYVRAQVNELNRVVYVCDEEGNASYVFDIKKLHDIGVNLQDLDLMTKDERGVLIKNHPGIGERVVQSNRWRFNVSELLSADIQHISTKKTSELTKVNNESVVVASSAELDPWRLFWTDPESGKHYGSIRAIARKLNIVFNTLDVFLKNSQLQTKKVSAHFKIFSGYAYEDIQQMSQISKFLVAPKMARNTVQEKDLIKDFWTDEAGKHWGSIDTVAVKLGITDTTLIRLLKESHLQTKNVRPHAGKIADGYCYEDVQELPMVREFLSNPKVSKDTIQEKDLIKDFWTDEAGKHWGSIGTVAVKLGITDTTLIHLLKKSHLQTKNIRSHVGPVAEGYCYEEVKELPMVKKFLLKHKISSD
ncbi:MAG: hypothetical protein HY973_02340 [Candidatus Kerfeldbacteria bacterium]|nr:hypothetical protein [Candidatus Kerfeldbacteria bacterium]